MGALASALAAAASCRDAPSGPKTYAGVDGVYAVQGTFDEPRSPSARFSGRVTLRQPDPTSPTVAGTASVTLYNGGAAVETYTTVFRAVREGERGLRFLLTTEAGFSGSWEFVGTVDGGRVSGTQYLDWYRIPGTGSFTGIGGAWSGTR